ncbi:hypothetical protein CW749_25980 [Vibrio sp. vnigr-6D03]|uniref:hypothetical protein n=1 Tax=Vibrio sp. vnigr-6D03 TaxID=2058088 RepID=UPI000C32AAC9|nr:hypothetical protein [Vibrio sp. vnigr-6D03]PKF76725.1 hypothetical protein CW749_25980 [Vibrio sp. vnigr-6D03]
MEKLGITFFDIALLILCPIGGVIGSFAYAIMDSIDPLNSPKDESKTKVASEALQEKRGIWLGLRCTLGLILGLVVSLYFIGSIQENISTVAKIVALSIVSGYAAPKIWAAQEIIVEAKMKKLSSDIEKS